MDYTFQNVTGHWRHLVDDTVRDIDDLPDEVTPNGNVIFTPYLGKGGQLPTGDPTRLVSVDKVTALIVDGELCDLQNRPGVKLVAKIGDNPVWWTATPKLVWRGITLPGKAITFGPTGTDVNIADLIDITSLPPDQLPAYKDAAVSATQAAESATSAENAAQRAEAAAAGVSDIGEQVSQVNTLVQAANAARDTAVAAKDTATAASAAAQDIVDNAEQILRDDLSSEITTATQAATAAAAAKTAAETARDTAAASATAAGNSASAANTSKTAAASSATTASTSATTASAAKTAAETARDTAAASATAAGDSASAAETFAVSATASADAAQSARTGAESARTAAETARDAAGASATAAGNSAIAAAASEAAAVVSAADAGEGAADAGVSATASADSAAAAAADRGAAQTAKAAAEIAASNASSSATSASSSATNAQNAQTSAAASAAAAAQSAQDAAEAVNDGVANAGPSTKGGVMLPGGSPGELGGTYDHPIVTGWGLKADLVDGKIPTHQIPALAMTDTSVVEDTAERLALDCQTGDVAVQTGNPGRGTYILKGTDPAVEGDWAQMVSPDSPVTSVNGHSGIVILDKGDIGLGAVDNTSDAAKPVSSAQQAALDGKVPTGRQIIAGIGLTGGGTLDQHVTVAVDFGVEEGKVTQGDDPRLSDPRIPIDGSVGTAKIASGAVTAAKIAAGALPSDLSLIVFGKDSPRATGVGDNPFGHKCQRAITIKGFDVQCLTADASGSLVVELRKNGTPVAGTSHAVAAADQVAGTRKTGLNAQFAAGDVLTVAVTGVGGTPGNGLAVHVEAVVA